MTLASRLALPAILGGIAALIASGVFAPAVHARGDSSETIARLTGDAHVEVLSAPASAAQATGALAASTLVWVDRCVDAEDTGWCLIERGGVKGWVETHHLTLKSL